MKLIDEFKEFINKGNAMDMAVGVIIGGAFTAIVTSLTTDIINPFIQMLTLAAGADGAKEAMSALVIPVTDEVSISFANLIAAIINFIIIAVVVFIMVKAINGVKNVGKKEEEAEPEAEAPTCPFCMEEIKEGATRCPHCAGELPEPAKAKEPAAAAE